MGSRVSAAPPSCADDSSVRLCLERDGRRPRRALRLTSAKGVRGRREQRSVDGISHAHALETTNRLELVDDIYDVVTFRIIILRECLARALLNPRVALAPRRGCRMKMPRLHEPYEYSPSGVGCTVHAAHESDAASARPHLRCPPSHTARQGSGSSTSCWGSCWRPRGRRRVKIRLSRRRGPGGPVRGRRSGHE